MRIQRKTKPTIDAVNDAVGALSDLLHSLRVHAKVAARDARRGGTKRRRGAAKSVRTAKNDGATAVRSA